MNHSKHHSFLLVKQMQCFIQLAPLSRKHFGVAFTLCVFHFYYTFSSHYPLNHFFIFIVNNLCFLFLFTLLLYQFSVFMIGQI